MRTRAQALARALRDMQARREAPTVAIIGMRARKDADSFIGALAARWISIIAVPLREAHVAPAIDRCASAEASQRACSAVTRRRHAKRGAVACAACADLWFVLAGG